MVKTAAELLKTVGRAPMKTSSGIPRSRLRAVPRSTAASASALPSGHQPATSRRQQYPCRLSCNELTRIRDKDM
jgi:hypothetical protein